MIRFWRNTTASSTTMLLTDQVLSYTIGATFIALLISSALLNLISFTYQCLNKPTISRRLFQLLAATDLVTSLYYPIYAAYMAFKPDLLPELASVGVVEAVFLKLGAIPIYLSVVITSLLSVARYLGVSDPLSVKLATLDRHFRAILAIIFTYTVAILFTLAYSMVKSHTTLYRGAGLTVYFWDARVLVEAGETTEEQPHLNTLVMLNLVLWVPALMHSIVGFVASISTTLLLRSKERRLSQVHAVAHAAPIQKNNSIKSIKLSDIPQPSSSPDLNRKYHPAINSISTLTINYVRPSCQSAISPALGRKISPSLANNRRGAVTILLVNIGNIVWLANFLMVLVIEMKKEYFGFVFLDSARFMGRLFVPQVLALLNPAIVVCRSSEIHASCRHYRNLLASRMIRKPASES